MIDSIFNNKEVLDLLSRVVTYQQIKEKEIPNTINQELITNKEYCIYMVLDAVYKYAVIIDDPTLLSNYLEKLELIIKKMTTHNEISNGIVKLLIKTVGHKFGISDYENIENKKIISRYIYEKYVEEGYLFKSCLSKDKDILQNTGIGINPVLNNDLKELDKVFKKYGINNVFRDDYYKFTDSFFMGCFYANNAPFYMRLLCQNIFDKENKKINRECYVLKNYDSCINNIDFACAKHNMTSKDENRIIDFYNNEWKKLDISANIPSLILVKRSVFESNNDKMTSINYSNDIFNIVNNILSSSNNNIDINSNIDSSNIKIIQLESVNNLYNNYKQVLKHNANNNDYGNISILILLGILLITLGVTILIIMMG